MHVPTAEQDHRCSTRPAHTNERRYVVDGSHPLYLLFQPHRGYPQYESAPPRSHLILSWLPPPPELFDMRSIHFDGGLADAGMAPGTGRRPCSGERSGRFVLELRGLARLQTDSWITSNRPLVGNIFSGGASVRNEKEPAVFFPFSASRVTFPSYFSTNTCDPTPLFTFQSPN